MGTLIRYLISFGLQLAWQRAGKGGATPPMRMPFGKNRGKTVPLPILGPWQMMVAMWLARRVWDSYGTQIKDKVRNVQHPLAGHINDFLSGTPSGASQNTPHPSPNTPNVQQSTPAQSTPAATSPAPPAAAPRPTPKYGTQRLDDTAAQSGSTPSSPLPPGSILSGLRGRS